MTSEQFCYWLAGFAAANTANKSPITAEQWALIQSRLPVTDNSVSKDLKIAPLEYGACQGANAIPRRIFVK